MLSLTLQEHLHARAPPPESWEWRRRLGWGGEDVVDIPEGNQEIRASAPPPPGISAHPFRFTGAAAQVTAQAGGSSTPPGAGNTGHTSSHLCLVLTPGVPGEHLEQDEQLQPGLRLRAESDLAIPGGLLPECPRAPEPVHRAAD